MKIKSLEREVFLASPNFGGRNGKTKSLWWW